MFSVDFVISWGAEMSGHTLRSRYMRQFTGLSRYARWEGRIIVTSYLLQIVSAIVAGHVALHHAEGFSSYALVGFLMVFIATRCRGLNNIVHECCHATFVDDREENRLLGSICASAVLSCYTDYRDEHLTHHQHLGDYDHDMDLQGIQDLKLHEPLTAKTLARHIITPLIGRHLPYYLGANLSDKDGRNFMYMKYTLIAVAFAFLILQPLTALIMVFVPFLLIYSTMNYWTDCMDHAGLVASEDELDSSRNIVAPGLVRWLLFPRSDCFHLVHHLFPHIPARHLESCHRLLEWDDVYASRTNATRRNDVASQPNVRPVVPAE